MEASRSPSGSTRRHGRNISYPRRPTRGPLDAADDPLSAPTDTPFVAPVQVEAAEEQSSLPDPEPEPALSEPPPPPIDLSFLQDPSNFHQIPTDDIPAVFLESQDQPPPATSLPDLLSNGHFRRAGEEALNELSKRPPYDTRAIFELLYARLACLVLIARPDLASHEATPLTDYLARNPPGAEDVLPLIPWELRLLLVRLQSISATDQGRRGVMALYALAAEVQNHITAAKESGRQDDINLWSTRLKDLGLRVVDTLVEIGELETATRHLDSLVDIDADVVAYRKALLRLRIGDVAGARRCIDTIQDSSRKVTLSALLDTADGNLPAALEQWQQTEDHPDQALFANNLAVLLLYTGQVAQAQQIFSNLAKQSPAFPGLLFNLGTVFELCTEQAVERKTQLASQMAAKKPTADCGGWERAGFEFKL